MKSLFKKQIVDERMELQNLLNAKTSGQEALPAGGFLILQQMHGHHKPGKYNRNHRC